MTVSSAGVDTGGKEAVFRRTELLALPTLGKNKVEIQLCHCLCSDIEHCLVYHST